MAQIFLNNCYATLAQPIAASDTQIELNGMNGFPASLGTGDYFLLTLYADTTRYGENIEVVKVTGFSGTTLTIERGFEGEAVSHSVGERVEARLTAATLDRMDQPNDWPSITDKPETATRWPAFSEVTDKPTTYPPSNHTHSISDVTNLQTSLNAKRDLTNTSFPRYDLASASATSVLNLATSQVFRISATSNRTISFSNAPGSGRAMTVVVHLYNSSLSSRTITWPSNINWADGEAPTLDGTKATVVLFWTGNEWVGTLGALS